MSDIKEILLKKRPDQDAEVGLILIEFYETMKNIEASNERAGKQATKIVMTIKDIIEITKQ